MFATIKTFCLRVFAAVAWLILGLLRLVRWLLNALIGSWQPPLWLRKSSQLSRAGGNWLVANPKHSGAGLLMLALLGGAGAYGWQWYKNLQCHTPSVTRYTPPTYPFTKNSRLLSTPCGSTLPSRSRHWRPSANRSNTASAYNQRWLGLGTGPATAAWCSPQRLIGRTIRPITSTSTKTAC